MTSHQGHIKYWNSNKGYGFIARDNDEDVFVHISQLDKGIQPSLGLQVCFGLKQDHLGRWQAQQVRLLDNSKERSGWQRLWRLILMVAALLLASVILIKSITPFYAMQPTAAQQTQQRHGLLLPGSPHANNPQLHHTLELILQGGPYPYRQDDRVFHNRERLLPVQASGFYREYTVETPGATDRGTRRVVTGGQPPHVWYYTQDHYRSFIRLDVQQ